MEQVEAISLASKGHSFLMTGSCGTGKTYTLKQIIQTLAKSKVVAVTATTGMASMQLGMDASTLHHWSGILDGRYSHQKLAELYDNDDKFASAKHRIASSDCLVIDEISMLSQKTFEMLEFACRHVKKNNLCFGGMQVIGSGDFKQLPPVPNRYLGDDGGYCFRSAMFDIAFPHHIQLLKVIRQKEKDLAVAVQELCNGSPTTETVHLLRGLKEPLDVPADQITRLYGTNFDVRFVNEQMLDAFEGNAHIFKATEEGNKNLLLGIAVPKTLVLKEGAPIILVKNLGGKLFNGQRGLVEKLEDGCLPVINFNGELHQLQLERFDVFDASTNRTLASRKQIPIILSFAMTVHRAQGQTIDNIEVDCSSFFAPGQLGVAVGRAVCKNGLRIFNLNMEAAMMKHPDCVYDFYKKPLQAIHDDMTCCSKCIKDYIEAQMPEASECCSSSTEGDSDSEQTVNDFPRLACQFDVKEFIDLNEKSEFMSVLLPDLITSEKFKHHVDYLNFKVDSCLSEDTDTNQKWVITYKSLNEFLVGKEHLYAIRLLFGDKDVSKHQNKMSSKLAFWLLDKKVCMKTNQILAKQSGPSASQSEEFSDAGSAKIRYIAGACVNKITKRLRESVERKFGATSKSSKIGRDLNYYKVKMLKKLRVSEDVVGTNDPSMIEITSKQNKNRGLTVVNDEVFIFFKNLNILLQSILTNENMHLNLERIHSNCQTAVDKDINLLSQWISLFSSEQEISLENEIFLVLVAELFKDVTEHFLRIAIVDSLKQFKRSIPRKKKQALRTKIAALGERHSASKDKKTDTVPDSIFICNVCHSVCEEEPLDTKQDSIGCDKCNKWFHYECVGLTGNESFLKRKNSSWFCSACTRKGKGRGKKTKV